MVRTFRRRRYAGYEREHPKRTRLAAERPGTPARHRSADLFPGLTGWRRSPPATTTLPVVRRLLHQAARLAQVGGVDWRDLLGHLGAHAHLGVERVDRDRLNRHGGGGDGLVGGAIDQRILIHDGRGFVLSTAFVGHSKDWTWMPPCRDWTDYCKDRKNRRNRLGRLHSAPPRAYIRATCRRDSRWPRLPTSALFWRLPARSRRLPRRSSASCRRKASCAHPMPRLCTAWRPRWSTSTRPRSCATKIRCSTTRSSAVSSACRVTAATSCSVRSAPG